MSDLIFNLRIWKFHFQITANWRIIPLFKWFDFWIGLYFDEKDRSVYFFLLPMIGLKMEGIVIIHNASYSFKTDPFIWLFTFGDNHYPMRRTNMKRMSKQVVRCLIDSQMRTKVKLDSTHTIEVTVSDMGNEIHRLQSENAELKIKLEVKMEIARHPLDQIQRLEKWNTDLTAKLDKAMERDKITLQIMEEARSILVSGELIGYSAIMELTDKVDSVIYELVSLSASEPMKEKEKEYPG